MKPVHVLLAALAVILMVEVHTSEAVECYVCNSHKLYEGEACLEPLEHPELLMDCVAEGIKDNLNYTRCRKIKQEVEGEDRVIRTCATSGPDARCVERTGTTKIYMTYCECEGEKCNSAPISISFSLVTLFIAAVLGTKLTS